MSSKLATRLMLAGLVAGVLPACGNINDGHPAAPFTVLASQSTAGVQANLDIFRPAISGDGRYAVFATVANTLVTQITVGFNVYRRNLQTGVTELVSVGDGGAPADGDSENPCISFDGRWVAFDSFATNLLTGPTPAGRQVFVRDMNETVGNGIRRVSESGPAVPGNLPSLEPTISADGQYIAFASLATNFGDAHANGVHNIYRRDMNSSAVLLISVSTGGGDPSPVSDGSHTPSISADGSRIAYASDCSDLVNGDINSLSDVFVATVSGVVPSVSTVIASPGTLGLGGGAGVSTKPSISGDGGFVAYESTAFDLTAQDTTILILDVFVFDMQGGTVQMVSVNAAGFQGAISDVSGAPSISSDGRFIAFESFAANLITGDTNEAMDVFIKDRVTGSVVRVSVDTSGQAGGPNKNSTAPSLSADGRAVAFLSAASFVKSDLNGLVDVYVRAPLR